MEEEQMENIAFNHEQLNELTADDTAMLKVNSRFLCQILPWFDNTVGCASTCWSALRPDCNSPRLCKVCRLKVLDLQDHRRMYAQLVQAIDIDLNRRISYMLHLHSADEDSLAKAPNMTLTVNSIEVIDCIYSFKKLFRMLTHPSAVGIEAVEPFDTFGISVVEFPAVNGRHPYIEYRLNGCLSFGTLCRDTAAPSNDIIIDNVKISNDNIEHVAKQIDAHLSLLYSANA